MFVFNLITVEIVSARIKSNMFMFKYFICNANIKSYTERKLTFLCPCIKQHGNEFEDFEPEFNSLF